jgi:hypothetical protein
MGHEKASTTLDLYVLPKKNVDIKVTGLFDAISMPPGEDSASEDGEPKSGKCL